MMENTKKNMCKKAYFISLTNKNIVDCIKLELYPKQSRGRIKEEGTVNWKSRHQSN